MAVGSAATVTAAPSPGSSSDAGTGSGFCPSRGGANNERLAFLGDAVLDYVLVAYFYTHPLRGGGGGAKRAAQGSGAETSNSTAASKAAVSATAGVSATATVTAAATAAFGAPLPQLPGQYQRQDHPQPPEKPELKPKGERGRRRTPYEIHFYKAIFQNNPFLSYMALRNFQLLEVVAVNETMRVGINDFVHELENNIKDTLLRHHGQFEGVWHPVDSPRLYPSASIAGVSPFTPTPDDSRMMWELRSVQLHQNDKNNRAYLKLFADTLKAVLAAVCLDADYNMALVWGVLQTLCPRFKALEASIALPHRPKKM